MINELGEGLFTNSLAMDVLPMPPAMQGLFSPLEPTLSWEEVDGWTQLRREINLCTFWGKEPHEEFEFQLKCHNPSCLHEYSFVQDMTNPADLLQTNWLCPRCTTNLFEPDITLDDLDELLEIFDSKEDHSVVR